MDSIKKFFPLAFKTKADVKHLLISVLVQVALDVVSGTIFGLLAEIPVVGGIIGIVGGIVSIYFTLSILITIIDYFKSSK
jgi:hypothetical protein